MMPTQKLADLQEHSNQPVVQSQMFQAKALI